MIIPFLYPDPRHAEMIRTIERARREVQEAMRVDLSGAKLAETIDAACAAEIKKFEQARGTFSRPVVVDPVLNHTELASRIAEARYWERYLGVKTPLAIEQIIQSWELDR